MFDSFRRSSSEKIELEPSAINCASVKSATSTASSEGFIKSRNLSPNSDTEVEHELRKNTLDMSMIFFCHY